VLAEFAVKGFAMDDRRLKAAGSDDYFEELLARVRDIRSSERVFWRKVLDIYATSVDYDPSVEASRRFFQTVQNKMHWAAHGHTAAEVIVARADADATEHGADLVGGDDHPQVRRGRRQELPRSRRDRGAEPRRVRLSGLRRAPGDEPPDR
jgi:hypothetical protein